MLYYKGNKVAMLLEWTLANLFSIRNQRTKILGFAGPSVAIIHFSFVWGGGGGTVLLLLFYNPLKM